MWIKLGGPHRSPLSTSNTCHKGIGRKRLLIHFSLAFFGLHGGAEDDMPLVFTKKDKKSGSHSPFHPGFLFSFHYAYREITFSEGYSRLKT